MKKIHRTRRNTTANDPPIAPPSTRPNLPLVLAACLITLVELGCGPRRLVGAATVLIADVNDIALVDIVVVYSVVGLVIMVAELSPT
jgi:hypothetical protein